MSERVPSQTVIEYDARNRRVSFPYEFLGANDVIIPVDRNDINTESVIIDGGVTSVSTGCQLTQSIEIQFDLASNKRNLEMRMLHHFFYDTIEYMPDPCWETMMLLEDYLETGADYIFFSDAIASGALDQNRLLDFSHLTIDLGIVGTWQDRTTDEVVNFSFPAIDFPAFVRP